MDRIEKAFDFAQETTKQVITLSTGIIALSVTLLKDVFAESASAFQGALLVAAWVAYLISIIAGIATLQSLTGNLERTTSGTPSVYSTGIRIVSGVQLVLFLIGTALMVWFGALGL